MRARPTSLRRLVRCVLFVAMCLLGALVGAAPAHSVQIILMPNNDQLVTGWTPTGCAAPRFHTCIDELSGSVNQADYVQGAANGGSGRFGVETYPASTITGVGFSAYMQTSTGTCASVIVHVRLPNGTSVASYTWTGLGTTSGGVSTGFTPVAGLTQAEVDGLYLDFGSNPTACSLRVRQANIRLLDSGYATAPTPTGTIVPNVDKVTTSVVPTSCISPSLYSCIDEVVPGSTNDSDSLSLSAGLTTSFELTTIASVGLVNGLGLNFRISSTGTCSITVNLRKSDNSLVSAATIAVGTATGNYGSLAADLALVQADLDGLYVQTVVGAGGCTSVSMKSLSIDVFAAPITLSGTVSDASVCGASPSIGLAVDGALRATLKCTSGTGAFMTSATWTAGQVLTLFYNNTTPTGATVMRTIAASSTPLTGVSITTNQVRLASLSASPITAADVALYDGVLDGDIPVTGASPLTVTSPALLTVVQGTFTPGVDVDTPSLWVRSGATYSAGASSLTLSGAGTGSCDNSTTLRPFCIAGAFTEGTGTVSYRSTADTIISTDTYATLDIQSTASNTFQFDAGTTTVGTLTISGSSGSPTVSTVNSPTVNVTGAVTVNGTATLGGAGTGTMTIGGNLSGTGLVNFSGGTVELSNAGSGQSVNANGTLPGTAWQFATLGMSTSGSARMVQMPGTSRQIRVATLLRVGDAANTNTTTLYSNPLIQKLVVTGSMNVTTRGSFIPGTTEITGNLTTSGALTAGGGIHFLGGGTSTWTNTGTGTVYALAVGELATAKELILAGTPRVSGTAQLAAPNCNTPSLARSATPGSPVTFDNTSLIAFSAYNGAIRDISFTLPVAAGVTGDGGGNTNATFANTGICTAPTTLYTNQTNAASGTTRPTNIDGRGAFHNSVANGLGTTADRYRYEVTTSLLDYTIVGLFPLNGSGADRSSQGNTATGTTASWPAGGSNFGSAAQFNGSSNQLTAPTTGAYNTTTFTVDLWMRANSTPTSFPTMVSRTDGTQIQFQIGFNTAAKTIVGGVTTDASSYFEVAAPSAQWLDDTWHHVALTANGSKQLRLYVDGVQVGSTVTYTGTLHTPNAPLYIGGAAGFGTNYFAGMIDDVQFSTAVRSQAELQGYARTMRPHASGWQSSGFNTSTGDTLGGSCVAAARCADAVFAGGDIHAEGARYFATYQLRTPAGLWSMPVSDYFTTADEISVTAPGSISIPGAGIGSDTTTSFAVTTNCMKATGCSLQMTTPSNTAGMLDAAGTASIPLFTTGAPTTWAPGAALGLGFTVLSSTTGKNTATWGTGTDFSDLSLLKFTGVGRTSTALKQTSGTGSETTTVGVRLNAPAVPMEAYSASFDLVALANP